MKKLINNPDNLVSELLEGYTLAFPEKVKLEGDDLVMRAYPKELGKVALVTLGGCGHEPGLIGFVGQGIEVQISVCFFAVLRQSKPTSSFLRSSQRRNVNVFRLESRVTG